MAFVGINGVGKSTSLAKVAYYLKENGIKVCGAIATWYNTELAIVVCHLSFELSVFCVNRFDKELLLLYSLMLKTFWTRVFTFI